MVGRSRGGGEDVWRLRVAGLLLVGMVGLATFSVSQSGDYDLGGALGGNNAAPGIDALLHGSVGGYVARQPLMGLTTILLRLPFAAFGSVLGNGLTVYRLGVFACLLPLALAAAWLIAVPELSRNQRLLRLLTAAVVIGSPIMRSALQVGHPEEVVAATLATGAVLAASAGKVRWAAALLGLAIGSKEWAVIAVLPVMIAVPSGRRVEAAVIAVALVLGLNGVAALADPAAFEQGVRAETTRYLSPLSPLWPFGTPIRMLGGGYVSAARTVPWGMTRTGAISLQLIAVAILGVAGYIRLRRTSRTCGPIRLLALLAALRCICDPADQQYYWIALLIPLAALESTENRLPTATVLLSTVAWLLFDTMSHVPATLTYLAGITAYAVLLAYIAREQMAAESLRPSTSAARDDQTPYSPASPMTAARNPQAVAAAPCRSQSGVDGQVWRW